MMDGVGCPTNKSQDGLRSGDDQSVSHEASVEDTIYDEATFSLQVKGAFGV